MKRLIYYGLIPFFLVVLLSLSTSGFAGTIPISTVKVSTEGNIKPNSPPNLAYDPAVSSISCNGVLLPELNNGEWRDSKVVSSLSTPYDILVTLADKSTLFSSTALILHWGYTGTYASNFTVYVSSDNINWQDYGTISWSSNSPCAITGTAVSGIKYVRIRINNKMPSNTPLSMAEIEIFGTPDFYRTEANFAFDNYAMPSTPGFACGNINPFPISNIWQNGQLPEISTIATAYDFKKSNGWVLLSKSFGIPNSPNCAGTIPYFMLYNKYKSIARVFIFNTYDDLTWENAVFTIKWPDASTSLLTLGNTLPKPYGQYASGAHSSDQFLMTVENTTDGWVMAEFPVSYDPATSYTKNSKLEFRMYPKSVDEVDLNGEFNLNITTKTIAGNKSNPTVGSVLTTGNSLLKSLPKDQVTNFLTAWGASTHDVITKERINDCILPALKTIGGFIGLATGTGDLVANIFKVFTGGGNASAPTTVSLNPMVGSGALTLSGSITDIGSSKYIDLWAPGTRNPGALEQDWTRMPMYNTPIGLFGLQSYPTLLRRDRTLVEWGGTDTGGPFPEEWTLFSGQYTTLEVGSNIKLAINPYSNATLIKSRACLIVSREPFFNGETGGGKTWVQINHLQDMINQKIFEECETPVNGLGYRTRWVDVSKFKGTTIVIPKPNSTNTAKVYLKLQLWFRPNGATDNKNDVMHVISYELPMPSSNTQGNASMTREQMPGSYKYIGPYIAVNYNPPPTYPGGFQYTNIFGTTVDVVWPAMESSYYNLKSASSALELLTTTASVVPDAHWNYDLLKSANDDILSDIFNIDSDIDIDIEGELRLYPNPVQNVLQINYSFNNEDDYKYNIEIIDFSGRVLVSETNIREQEISFDVSSYKAGIYIMKLTDLNRNEILTRKFIKN